MEESVLITRDFIDDFLPEYQEYIRLRADIVARIDGSKSFHETWEILFGRDNKVNQIDAFPKFRALIFPMSKFTMYGGFYIFERKISPEVSNEIERNFIMSHLSASALIFWLARDNYIYKEDFIEIPKKFIQASPESIGSYARTYELGSTAAIMHIIINLPGFINTYDSLNINELRPCKYAIRKSRNAICAVDFLDNNNELKSVRVAGFKTKEYYTGSIFAIKDIFITELITKIIEAIGKKGNCNPIPYVPPSQN